MRRNATFTLMLYAFICFVYLQSEDQLNEIELITSNHSIFYQSILLSIQSVKRWDWEGFRYKFLLHISLFKWSLKITHMIEWHIIAKKITNSPLIWLTNRNSLNSLMQISNVHMYCFLRINCKTVMQMTADSYSEREFGIKIQF